MRKLLFFAAFVAAAQRPWPPPGMRCPERTLVLFKSDPASVSKMNQFYDEHVSYMLPLMKSGKIISAGPTNDGGAVVILATRDWAEAEALLNKEPFTREGITRIASHTVWNACEAAP